MKLENVNLSINGAIALLTLNRPEKMNALTAETLAEIREVCLALDTDKNVSVLVIAGNEKFFCAGADINAISRITSPEEGYRFTRCFHDAFRAIEETSIPVIAAVRGYALGGGLELAINCDLLYASENAVFSVPEIDLGAFPAGTGTQKLPRLLGMTKAKELLLTGRRVKAAEALAIGLVNAVFPTEGFMDAVLDIAAQIASKPRPALTANKRLANVGSNMPFHEASIYESTQFASLCLSPDFQQRIQAFIKKS